MDTHERFGYPLDAERFAVEMANLRRRAYGVLPTGEVIDERDARWMECVACYEPDEIEVTWKGLAVIE